MLVQGQQQEQQKSQSDVDPSKSAEHREVDAGESNLSTRPEGLADAYWDGEKNEAKWADLIKDHGELAKFKTDHDEALSKLPKDEAGYSAPERLFDDEELKSLPEGAGNFQVDSKNPLYGEFQKFALAAKLPPELFHQGLKLVTRAGFDFVENVYRPQIKGEVAESIKALGANGPAREKAVIDALKAKFGDKAPSMNELDGDYITIFETLIEAADKNNVVTFNNKRERDAEKISDEDYEKMTPRQRLEFARSAQAGGR